MYRVPSRRARVLACAFLALAALPAIGSTFASGVGSPAVECADNGFAGHDGVKYEIDEQRWDTEAARAANGITLTIEGLYASWSASSSVAGVIVKGGTNADDAPPAVYGGDVTTGLHAPHNPNSDTWYGISHVTFCISPTPEDPPPTPTAQPLKPLDVSVEANGSYTKTHLWSIDKTAAATWIARAGSSAPLSYAITATETGYELSDVELTGTVEIDNPNDTTVSITSLLIGPGCAIDAPVASAAPGTSSHSFTCDVSGTTNEQTLPEVIGAALVWADPAPTATATFDDDSTAVVWVDTHVHPSVTIDDAFDGGAAETLGSADGTTTLGDVATAATPDVEGCRTVTNTATIVETGASDTAEVTVCRQALTIGGHTIGFWQNKNGQAVIGANATMLCGAIAEYGNVFAGTGFPTGLCMDVTLKLWVSSVVKGASSKDATLMFRAQLLGTALGALTVGTPTHLGETDVPVNGALLGTTASCLTVTDLLSAANASFSSLAADRAGMLSVKDTFDRINNNAMSVCP